MRPDDAPKAPPSRDPLPGVSPDPRLDPPPPLPARLAVRLAQALWPLPAEPPEPASVRSLLVVRTDNRVGNALLTIPLVRALQRALPQAQVDLLLPERLAFIAEGLPRLRVLPFRRAWPFTLRSRYEVVIDAAHWHAFSTTSALLSRWAASRWVIGSQRGPYAMYSRAVAPPAEGTPEVEAKLDLARALGVQVAAPPMETALGLRAPWPQPEPFVAMNPGARKADHRWPPERFAALARALPVKSVVFWGPGEEELARAVGGELAPPTSLDQLAAAFRAARLVVTNDTGPMHLAVACGAPVLALFKDRAGLRWSHPGARFRGVVAPADDAEVASAARQLLDTARVAAEPPSP